MKERLIQKGGEEANIRVVPLWANAKTLFPVTPEQNSFRKEQHLEDKFVVMYSGNHSICHPLDTLLEAAQELRDEPEYVFVFIGDGERVKDVTDFKNKHQLGNIVQLGYQKRADTSHSLSAANLHVVIVGDPYVGIVHPSKIYGILAVQRPFLYIGPGDGAIYEITKEFEAGLGMRLHAKHGEHPATVSIIREIAALDQGRQSELEAFSRDMMSTRFEQQLVAKQLLDVCGG